MKMNISAQTRLFIRNAKKKIMPDITETGQAKTEATLDRVGMRGIEIPVLVKGQDQQVMTLPAKAQFFVSLDDPKAKGIHMSRLYLTGQKLLAHRELTLGTMKDLLEGFIGSHEGLSQQAAAKISFDYMLHRPALLSDNGGWRFYPVTFDARLDKGKFIVDLNLSVTYSSTCPCSAALSRQLMQKKFEEVFDGQDVVSAADVQEWLGQEDAVAATPHSQRSHAHVILRFIDVNEDVSLANLVNILEQALATPVQTAVKRVDEQEFARLNAENLMFCEDAARTLKKTLDAQDNIADYRVEVEHLESLHAHDAVAITTKGIENGLQP